MTSHLNFFCFLLCRIEELCPNHTGNSKPAAAFIRTQCLPEALKCLGFPNQKKQTHHSIKHLLCWIHLCLCENKTDFAKLCGSVFQPELLQLPYHHLFIWILGPIAFSLPLLSLLFLKALILFVGPQIDWYRDNELRHWGVWMGAQVSRKPFQCLHLQRVSVRGGWGKHLFS